MSLTGKTKASSYKDILQMNNSNNGVDSTTRTVVDGEGTASAIRIADDHLQVTPANDSTGLLKVTDKDGNVLFTIDKNRNIKDANGDPVHMLVTPDEAKVWESKSSDVIDNKLIAFSLSFLSSI